MLPDIQQLRRSLMRSFFIYPGPTSTIEWAGTAVEAKDSDAETE